MIRTIGVVVVERAVLFIFGLEFNKRKSAFTLNVCLPYERHE